MVLSLIPTLLHLQLGNYTLLPASTHANRLLVGSEHSVRAAAVQCVNTTGSTDAST